jgi:hypothetical protein
MRARGETSESRPQGAPNRGPLRGAPRKLSECTAPLLDSWINGQKTGGLCENDGADASTSKGNCCLGE